MSKPAHSHAQRSLQSVYAVGSHVRRNHAAGVTHSAPGHHLQTAHTSDQCDLRRCQPALRPKVDLAPANNTLSSTQFMCASVQCLKASAQVSTRIQVCPLAHLHHNKAQIVSLRPPHDSNVARMMTWCCDIPVHSAINSVAPTSGHVPYAVTGALLPTESQ